MCGIVGYIGFNQASDFLLDGMSKLEYRAQPLPDCILTDFVTMSLAKICDKYKDTGHIITSHKLNKQFVAKYGMTKSEYRKQLQNSN